MDKFSYGNYDPSITDLTFDSTKGYVEPSGEAETRKQFSYPLKELKDFINNIVAVNSDDDVIQLTVDSQGLIKYRLSSEDPWQNTASSGHEIFVENEGVVESMPQRARMKFVNTTVSDDGIYTVIEGIKGDKGETGAQGPTGPGIAQGGTTGQFLTKKSATDYDTQWSNAPQSIFWGNDIGSGTITTLFEDSAKTSGLYPRTKVSAVTNASNVSLQTLLDAKMESINSDTVFTINKDESGNTLATPITFKIVAKS